MNKEEALKLLDKWDGIGSSRETLLWATDAYAMIRRLVEELDKQEHCCPDCGCHFVGEFPFNYAPQTKPLSDDEIGDCVDDCFGLMALQHKYTYSIDQVQEYGLKLCKAIEERHGIK